ncbi:restriction endonuclease subunit S [Paenibacillus sp. S-38]|uniref:restriction endonuclease subunit S n=1 Tax=Paenibacillus sp. S-38 TaxID=3416710 RepID=UPI003CE8FE89
MSRAESLTRIMKASAKIQLNIALMLEAKTAEAEKSRHWICNHLSAGAYEGHAVQVKETMDIHDQLIELIEGLTKMENALTRNLQILLNQKDEGGGLGEGGMQGGGFGDMFGLGGN